MKLKEVKKIIENKIDINSETKLGQELNACISIMSRAYITSGKTNKFIKEFTESINIYPSEKNVKTVSNIIFNYMYPKNIQYWNTQDKRYLNQIKNSYWLQSQKV